MAKTHWKQLVNNDYIGAYALDGQDLTLTIGKVAKEIVTGSSGRKEECTVIHWREDQLPMICNRTNAKTISKLYGPYVEDWAGNCITLFPTTTRFGGETVECLRIRPQKPARGEPEIKCEKCGGTVRAAQKMSARQLADYTKSKYGAVMCAPCATRAAQEQAAAKPEVGVENASDGE